MSRPIVTDEKPSSAGFLCCFLSCLLALACTRPAPDAPASPAEKVRVAVSVPPQAYFVDRIGGDRVAVQVMIPPGSSPATYEPSPRQMTALAAARLYVKVGHPDFPFERKHLDALIARHPGLEVVDMAAGVSFVAADGHGAEGETDPHVWLSPEAVKGAARHIARALERVDPDGAALYAANAEAFLRDVETLDRELETAFARLERRRFLVQHPAWGHLAARYGLEQVAIESGGKDPGPAALMALVDEARREGVRVVFVQQGFSAASARAIAREIGARVVTVDPLAYDWLANLRRVAALLREALAGAEAAG